MAAETQYIAHTGIGQITTANTSLDGSGTSETIVPVITGAENGTLIKKLFIKAIGNTSFGMIRLFVYNGTITKLIKEINVPNVTYSARNPTFEVCIELDYFLESGDILKAATQVSNTFNVIAEGLDWKYYTTSVRAETTRYTANTGMVTISTANSELDGNGAMGNVLTATTEISGTLIQSINIKSQVSTNAGMVRIFIYDDGTEKTYLLTEVFVPYVTKSSIDHSFSYRIDFGGKDFALQSDFILKASTENAQAFNVIAEGLDWEYPS